MLVADSCSSVWSHDLTMRETSWSVCISWPPGPSAAGRRQRRAQRAHRVMESGMCRPGRDAADLGDPLERQIEVVVEHHHRPVIHREAAEATLELVAIDDRAQVVVDWLVAWQQPQVRRPATLTAALGVAGAHEEPVRPGLEAGRVAELRDVLPDRNQRLLGRVLGKVQVAQDPARHGKEVIADLSGDLGICA
jgi:hypothetical protein